MQPFKNNSVFVIVLWLSGALLVAVPQSACGGGGGPGPDPDAGVNSDGAVLPDGAVSPDGAAPADGAVPVDGAVIPETCTPTTSLSLSQILADPSYGFEVVDEDEGVLVSIPEYLSGATRTLSAVDLTTGQEAPVTYDVTGTVPLVKVAAATFDAAAGHTLLLAYAMARPGDGGLGDHMEILRLTLSGITATLERVDSANPPTSQGIMWDAIYPEGDGVHYRAFRFAQNSQRVAVSGASATWEPEVTLTWDGEFDWNYFAHDPTGHRLLVYGEQTIQGTPPDFTITLEPNVFELQLAGGTHWTRVTGFGEAPPSLEDESGIFDAVGLWDDGGDRLVVLLDHWVYDPWFEQDMLTTGIWSLSSAGQWSVLNEDTQSCCLSWWGGADDAEHRRSLAWSGSGVTGIDLSEGHEGEGVAIDLDDAVLSVSPRAAVFDSSRSALLATSSSGLVRLGVGAGDRVWHRADGGAALPTDAAWGHVLAYDAAADRAILFGGADSNTYAATQAVYTLELGATSPTWTAQSPGGPTPAARIRPGALFDASSRTLYVVGGYQQDTQGYTHLADVMALDVATLTWRTVATLPAPRAAPILQLTSGGDALLVLLGTRYGPGSDPTLVADAYRVTLSTGAVETLTLAGDLPTRPSVSLAGLALPSQLVILSPEPAGVELFSAALSGSTVTLTRTTACEEPRTFGYANAVVDPSTGTGWVVGSSVWEIHE